MNQIIELKREREQLTRFIGKLSTKNRDIRRWKLIKTSSAQQLNMHEEIQMRINCLKKIRKAINQEIALINNVREVNNETRINKKRVRRKSDN